MRSPLDDLRFAQARGAADVLYAQGAARVWLFGSLAWGQSQDGRSDIDLAVDGMSGFVANAVVPLIERTVGCPVDVISFDEALPSELRAQALRSRILLARRDMPASLNPPSRWFAADWAGRRLHLKRLETVRTVLARTGAQRVIDLGCGAGWLLELLARDARHTVLAGADLNERMLTLAAERFGRVLTPEQRGRIQLFISVLTWRDPRLLGWDAATVVEVIEHLDTEQREAFEHVLFEFARPSTIIVTTPNAEYNSKFRFTDNQRFRHKGHRFEWTRAEFAAWADAVARRGGYLVELTEIGTVDPVVGAATQMAVLTRTF